jgi:hypothetical protein
MFQIRIEGYPVQTPPDQRVQLEKFNPAFDFGQIRGSKTTDFSLPVVPVNQKIFGWYENPQMGFNNQVMKCEKYADGQFIEKGFVALRDATNFSYNVYFTQNLGEIFGPYQSVLLNLLPLGSEPVPTPSPEADHLVDKYCWPTIINPSFYGAINDFDTESLEFNPNARVPMLYLRFIFERLADLCDFTFTGDFFTHPVLARLIIYNTFSLDDATELTYANHLPELTIPDLLKELRSLFNLYLEFDVSRRILRIDFTEDVMALPTKINWTAKASPTHKRTPVLNSRLELDWDLDSGDELMKIIPWQFVKYQSPSSGDLYKIKSKFSSLISDPETGLAKVQQVGITPRFNQLNQRFAPRLLFWNGTIDNVPNATNAHESYKLTWHGENNLKEKFWTRFEAWRANTFRLSKPVLINAADLAAWNFRNKVHINGVNYYVDSLTPSLPIDGPTTLELWKA